MNEKFEFGYPGGSSTCQKGSDINTIVPPGDELIEQKGLLVNLCVPWSDMIFTVSPEYIKTILAMDGSVMRRPLNCPTNFNTCLQVNASTIIWVPFSAQGS
jgi:hypothetical protein